MAGRLQRSADMKRTLKMALTAGVLALAAGPAFAQQPPAGSDVQQPSGTAGQLLSTTVNVVNVDRDKRELTLRNPNGESFVVHVPESVRRFDEIKPGDQINLTYYRAIAISLQPPGAPSGMSESQSTQRSTGALPAGAMERKITTSVQIVGIDRDRNTLTVRGPAGRVETIAVGDPQNQRALRNLKPGDRLQVTYTEAMAAAIEPR